MHRLWLDEMLMVDIRIGVKAFVEKVWTPERQCCSRDIAEENRVTDGETERRAKKGGDTFHQAEKWCPDLLVGLSLSTSIDHAYIAF